MLQNMGLFPLSSKVFFLSQNMLLMIFNFSLYLFKGVTEYSA